MVGYLRTFKKFKEKGIVLKHLSGGAPGRSTKLISIQCENGKHARSQRGIFMDNGMLSFVTSCHKDFRASQSMKIVHRFVPEQGWEMEPETKQFLSAGRVQAGGHRYKDGERERKACRAASNFATFVVVVGPSGCG